MKRLIVVLVGLLFGARVLAEEKKSLQECIELALRHHPSLQAGAARLKAAQARTRQVAAGYLPQIDATYAANRRSTSVAARTGTTLGTATQTFNFFNTGVSFSQLLFDFGQTFHSLQAAQADADATWADLETQREQVIWNVKQAYFALLTAQSLRDVAAEAVRQSEKHLDLARGRYDVGLAPRLDVTREQTQLAANRLDLLRADNNIRLGREVLRNALGLREPVRFDLQEVRTPAPQSLDEDALVHRAWELRPEILQLQAQIRSAQEQVLALERSHLPAVTAVGQYQWSGPDYPLQQNWNVGAAVTLPLFRGGLTVAQVEAAKQTAAALRHDVERTKQQIALEVRQALLRLQEAAHSIEVAREGTQQARQTLDLAEGRYATGVGNIIELTDAQTAFVSAKGQMIQSHYDYQTALAALEKAVGSNLAPSDAASKNPLE
ncbi:MAG: outer membrane efflux protein [Candidatus Binatia bacterium]|nr:MAG: outer membrane efflux protein [Candidatus Binatia bacterium]